VLALCIGLSAMFAAPFWIGGNGELGCFPFIFIVAGFAVYQLLRPTPERVTDDE
jgi:hypothetical protein